ncbi:MAG TPA: hypothetical protein VE010_12850, partial [Thermoanaerobaculia bacterium]|nr:hypothetical protein [Thermoanaerobaculia bacterium]
GLSLATRPTDSASPFGISSFETITGSGYLSFTPSQTNLVIQAGLAPADTTRALTEPSFYGFRLGSNGRYDIYANAVNANKNAVYTTASVFRLEVTRQRIRWFVDGVRVHEVTANIPASLRLDVSSTAEGAELHSVEYDVTTDGGRARAAAAANGSFRLPLRGIAGDSIRVAARDRHRLPLTSGEVTLTLPSGIGVASVTLNPSEIIGGRSAIGTVTLLAPAGSEGAFIELASSNATAAVPASIVIPAGASSGTFTVTTTPVLSAIDATITAAYGGIGASAIAQVIKDNVAPSVTITAPAANARYTEGQTAKIAVQATITDADAGMKRAFVSLDGVDYPMTAAGNVYSAQVPVPFVEGTTDVTKTLVVTGEDNSANLGTSSVDIIIAPVVDSAPPSISITCGTDGAFYPPGYAARLRFIARGPSAANPLQSVSVTITDPNGVATTYTPAAVTGVPDAYEFTFTVPDVADGSAFAMRATAMASSGSSAFVDATFRIVKGATEIKTNVTIGAADTTYDNKVVVIYPGAIVTMDGAHTFDRLIVLGTLQPAVAKTLDVTANALFVACDAKLDASALGYAFRTTYPGARNVTRIEEGASHIGRGARVEAGVPLTGATYGSISEPREL